MTLQQLQYFVTVCKYQNLTKAAKELSISQPGISTSIRDLESECGFALFEHRPNSITLTDQGAKFLREAEHMLHAYSKLQKNAKLIAEEKMILRIGVAPMGAGTAFPRLRKGFHAAHPDITFEITEDSTESLYQKIDTGELDFALCVSISLPDENYRYVTIGHSRLLFCVNKDNPLAREQINSLQQIGQTPLVMLSDHYSQTKYLKRLFHKENCKPNVIQYTSQVFTIFQHIRENAAAGFLSEDIARQDKELVSFVLQEVDAASITMIRRKDAKTFPAVDTFIHYIRNIKKNLNSAMPPLP